MIIQAKCPGCRTVLRIPSEWVDKTIRCKECGIVIRAERKSAGAPLAFTIKKTSAARSGSGRADAAPAEDEFDFTSSSTEARRGSSGLKQKIIIGVSGVVILGVIAAAIHFLTPTPTPTTTATQKDSASASVDKLEPAVFTGPFPRRLLAIQVCNYLYFDALGYGAKPYDGHALVERLTQFLHVPRSQVAELSDATPGNQARPPMKQVVEKAIADFLKASRPQDRVVVLFAGHLIEVEDQPYLVPMEGDSADKNTLLSLAWVYEQFGKCPARQKVLVLDVCRFDPTRGAVRPGSGPLGEKTFALLQRPPTGTQVWTACSAGQYSYEDGVVLHGSVFLTKILEALAPGQEASRAGSQKPQESLPLASLAGAVNPSTEREVDTIFRQKQTPLLFGEELASADVANDPKEPPKLSIDWPQGKDFKPARKELIQGILKQAAEIPPVKTPPAGAEAFRSELFPFFSETIMKDYQDAGGKTPFRDAIQRATAVLKNQAKAFPEVFRGNIADLKKRVANDQRGLATATLELNEELERLVDAGKQRDQEPSKRWQAQFDYVHARLLERIAFTFEYNYLLAGIRTESLPERDPKQHSGWRLASREKMQAKGDEGKQAKKLADDAKKIFRKIAEEHRGTPWEVLAKRDAMNSLGLEWMPTR